MNLKIKDITKEEKPRERFLEVGEKNISNEELLSIIIGSGAKEMSAKSIASLIINKYKGIENLKNLSVKELIKFKGIGSTKAIEIISSIEFGRRVYCTKNKVGKILNDSDKIYSYFRSEFEGENQEKFIVLYLDTKNKLIAHKLLFIGTLNQSCVHPREIFKEAFKLSANAIICIHNHPSGDVTPSVEDINVTNMLIKISEIMGIIFIDHLIFGTDKYYSFFKNMDKHE